MPKRFLTGLFCTIVLLAAAGACAQPPPATDASTLLAQFGGAPNGLARYELLTAAMHGLDSDDQSLAKQLLATVDSELGLYNEAVMVFPFDNRIAPPASMPLPSPGDWRAVDAADAVAKLAAKRHIVMVNEAHHDAHTRELTLALLPRLRALGYRYFAAEALSDKDTDLMRRGYPIESSGSEYLYEPLYGEIVRQAIRLGYTIVPYDSDTFTAANRESGEAHALYEKVFAKDPNAKLFVHAGYSHIDKQVGNLGDDIQPMALQLKSLSGHDPLCVDQVQFRDVAVGGIDFGFYDTLAVRFSPQGPIVLRHDGTGEIWSSNPRMHDVTVILPPAAESDLDTGDIRPADELHRVIVLPRAPFDVEQRPSWLSLGGQRVTYPISTDLCGRQIPCVVDAHYPGEPDTAPPADRYTFLRGHRHNVLYLYPGRYRLRAWNASGATLSQQDIDVQRH